MNIDVEKEKKQRILERCCVVKNINVEGASLEYWLLLYSNLSGFFQLEWNRGIFSSLVFFKRRFVLYKNKIFQNREVYYEDL